MNMPLTLPGPHPADVPVPDDIDGCEFVDGRWQPKHPDHPPDYYPYRDGHEFVDGQWVEQHMSMRSDLVGINLGAALRDYSRRTKAGRVQSSKAGYQCFPDDPRRVRLPDPSFIAAARVTQEVRDAGNCPIAPDFAAEVVSPNDEATALNRKVHEYLAVRVRLLWLIFPESRSVWVLRSNGAGAWVAGTGELSGEEVMPGFTISLDTLFAED
jgi:Uma2 family endonuclease